MGPRAERDGSKLYTANGPSGDVSIVDVATGKVEKKIATGEAVGRRCCACEVTIIITNR